MSGVVRGALFAVAFLLITEHQTVGLADESTGPETVIRALVRANAEMDMPTLSRFMAHDADIISYSIGGRKYVGWPEFEHDMQEEFSSVVKLELPIHELKVWTKGTLAWFTMELDYTRFVGEGPSQRKTVLALRESGVLEEREGQWVLLSWHESLRNVQLAAPLVQRPPTSSPQHLASNTQLSSTPDLSGEWEVLEVEDDKRYKATLDRLWQGTWQQPGNDREGGFELLLSEDGTQAKGVWWYSRVGTRNNIPPREHGGTYQWKRLTPVPPSQ
jgi:hypothetical protein